MQVIPHNDIAPDAASRSEWSDLSKRPSSAIDIAARSMLDSRVRSGTVASVVAERALDHCWEGLFQFAAVRAGVRIATSLLEELARQDREGAVDWGDGAPARAQLYRRMLQGVAAHAPAPLSCGSPLWWRPHEVGLRRRMVALRAALPPRLRDVLELRHTRGLSLPDVAHVLDLSEADVECAHREGLEIADRVLGTERLDRGGGPCGMLLEAFALNPRKAPAPPRCDRKPLLARGDVVAGRYEVQALLGVGTFADVYRARDREVTDHVVALKLLRSQCADSQSIETAMREVQLIAAVFHPSVVQLKDHGWHAGRLWFVMPLYRGETLQARLARGPLARDEARRIFEPLAEALATMHRAGVLHQDIKPANVLLAELDPCAPPGSDRRVLPVLIDLGVAAKNAELVLAGTPAYLAPEVAARFAGQADPPVIGPKADIFSLSLTLRRALDPSCAEEVPGGAVDAFIARRARHAPAAPTDRGLRDLRTHFETWLHFSPDARPTAEGFRRELAVLTCARERATRRKATVRAVMPMAVAALTVFGAAFYQVSREASHQRMEASQARERVASVSESLMRHQAQQRALEADVARWREQYQRSRLTREQLAVRLAENEGQMALSQQYQQEIEGDRAELERRVVALRKQRKRLLRTQTEARDQRNELNQRLERAERQLEVERARRRDAGASVARLRGEVRVLEAALDETERQLRERVSAGRHGMHGTSPAERSQGRSHP